jgi:hypothetical protein
LARSARAVATSAGVPEAAQGRGAGGRRGTQERLLVERRLRQLELGGRDVGRVGRAGDDGEPLAGGGHRQLGRGHGIRRSRAGALQVGERLGQVQSRRGHVGRQRGAQKALEPVARGQDGLMAGRELGPRGRHPPRGVLDALLGELEPRRRQVVARLRDGAGGGPVVGERGDGLSGHDLVAHPHEQLSHVAGDVGEDGIGRRLGGAAGRRAAATRRARGRPGRRAAGGRGPGRGAGNREPRRAGQRVDVSDAADSHRHLAALCGHDRALRSGRSTAPLAGPDHADDQGDGGDQRRDRARPCRAHLVPRPATTSAAAMGADGRQRSLRGR